jgi:hypothetical protein
MPGRTIRNPLNNIFRLRNDLKELNAEISRPERKSPHRRSRYISIVKLVGSTLFNQLIIETQDQNRGRPLSDKKGLMVSI